MRYVSIDIETTGLNPETCQIFEFAAIVDDTKKSNTVPRQSFQCFVVPEDGIIRGEAQGLMMNGQILERIAVRRSEDRFTFPRYLTQKFRQFLLESGFDNEKITVAGKNFAGFDLPFLRLCPGWSETIRIHSRTIDPGSLYFDPLRDTVVPDTKECANRAGLTYNGNHEALGDAAQIIQILRAKWGLL